MLTWLISRTMENFLQQNPPGFCGSYKWQATMGSLKGLSRSISLLDKWNGCIFFFFNQHVNLSSVWILDDRSFVNLTLFGFIKRKKRIYICPCRCYPWGEIAKFQMVLEIIAFKYSSLYLLCMWIMSLNSALWSPRCPKSQERNHSSSLETHSVTCNTLWPGKRSLSTDTVCWQTIPVICVLCSLRSP